jgi:dienelactone hydrolase
MFRARLREFRYAVSHFHVRVDASRDQVVRYDQVHFEKMPGVDDLERLDIESSSCGRIVLTRILIAFVFLCSCVASVADASSTLPASVFSYDASRPLDLRIARTWREGTTTFEDATFASPFGRRIHAEIVLPPGTAMHPGVLFVHWLGDVKTTNLTEFLPDARSLAGHGVASVLVDAMWAQPGWFDKVRSTETDYEQSIRQVVDLRRALDLLVAQPHVDSNDIAYVGHDFGAMYGAVLSGLDGRPKCYVLMAGVPTFSEWYLLGTPPKNKPAYVAQMRPLDPPGYLARSSARCFLFQDALKDQYVPVSEAQSFAAPAPGERGILFYRSDHGLADPEIMTDRLSWLTTRLLPARK